MFIMIDELGDTTEPDLLLPDRMGIHLQCEYRINRHNVKIRSISHEYQDDFPNYRHSTLFYSTAVLILDNSTYLFMTYTVYYDIAAGETM